MTPEEADELYAVVLEAFPGTPAERAYRLRQKFIESGVIANSVRNAIWDHRHRFDWLTEPHLLAEIARLGNPAVDAAARRKDAAAAVAARIKAREGEKAEEQAGRERMGKWLAKLPADVLAELVTAALAKIPDPLAAKLRNKPVADSPMLSALVVVAFKERSQAASHPN